MYQVPNLKTTAKKQQIYWESSQVFDLNVSATVCFVVDGVAKLVFLSGGHALGILQPYNCIRLLLSVVNWRKIKCVIYNRSRTHCTENACLILLLCPAVPFYFSTFLTYYFKEQQKLVPSRTFYFCSQSFSCELFSSLNSKTQYGFSNIFSIFYLLEVH